MNAGALRACGPAAATPQSSALLRNVPNPFNPQTAIRFIFADNFGRVAVVFARR